jgi:hypothetical protein
MDQGNLTGEPERLAAPPIGEVSEPAPLAFLASLVAR